MHIHLKLGQQHRDFNLFSSVQQLFLEVLTSLDCSDDSAKDDGEQGEDFMDTWPN